MPSRDKLYHCYCAGCCEVDQDGTAINPTGKFQLERYKAIHLCETPSLDPIPGAPRVDAENFALRAIAQPGTSDIDSLSTKLFVLPLKLWASHEEFQAVASANIGDVGIPDINDLVDAVGWISIVDSSNIHSKKLQSSGMPSWRESKADRILDSIEARIPSAQQRTFESASVDTPTACSQHGGEEHLGQDIATGADLNVEAVKYDSFLVVLFGLGWWTGEFVLGVVSIILTLAFQLLGARGDTLHHHTLAQIPKNMKTALERFSLNALGVPR
ncbi:hypothetical protein EDD16DRAFT_1514643 [Pisolithus croceorrhizus]|nr:hypothetical protein EDD16DRAFT_1514643 [Pisolithus croceorrhizus]